MFGSGEGQAGQTGPVGVSRASSVGTMYRGVLDEYSGTDGASGKSPTRQLEGSHHGPDNTDYGTPPLANNIGPSAWMHSQNGYSYDNSFSQQHGANIAAKNAFDGFSPSRSPQQQSAESSSSKLQDRIAELEQALNTSRQETTHERSERSALQQQVNQMNAHFTSALDKMAAEKSALHEQWEETHRSLQDALTERATVQERLQDAIFQRDAAIAESRKLATDMREMMSSRHHADAAAGALNEIQEREMRLEDRIAEVRRKEEAVARREQGVEEREQWIQAREAQLVEDSMNGGGGGDAGSSSSLAEREAAVQEQLDEVENEREMLAEISAQIHKAKVESEKERDALEREKGEVAERRREVEASAERVERERREVESLRRELESTKAELAAREKGLKVGLEGQSALQEETAKVHQLRATIDSERATLAKKEAEIRDLMETFKRNQKDLDAKSAEVSDLRRQLETDRRQFERDAAHLAEREERVKKLSEDFSTRQSHTTEEGDRIARERSAVESQRRQIEVEKAKLSVERAAIDADLGKIRSDRSALTERENTLRKWAEEVGHKQAAATEEARKVEEGKASLEEAKRQLDADRKRFEADRSALTARELRHRELMDDLVGKQSAANEERARVEELRLRCERERTKLEAERADLMEREAQLRQRTEDLLAGQGAANEEANKLTELRRQIDLDRVQVEAERARVLQRETEHERHVEEWAKRIASINEEAARVAERSRQLDIEKMAVAEREAAARRAQTELEAKQRELEGTIRGFAEFKAQLEAAMQAREATLQEEKRDLEAERRAGREREARGRADAEELLAKQRSKLDEALRQAEEHRLAAVQKEEAARKLIEEYDEKQVAVAEELAKLDRQRSALAEATRRAEEERASLDKARAALALREADLKRSIGEAHSRPASEVGGSGFGGLGGGDPNVKHDLLRDRFPPTVPSSEASASPNKSTEMQILMMRIADLERSNTDNHSTINRLNEALDAERRKADVQAYSNARPFISSPVPSSKYGDDDRIHVLENKIEGIMAAEGKLKDELVKSREEVARLKAGREESRSVASSRKGSVSNEKWGDEGRDMGNQTTAELLNVIVALTNSNQNLSSKLGELSQVQPTPLPMPSASMKPPRLPESSRSARGSLVGDRGYMQTGPSPDIRSMSPRGSLISRDRLHLPVSHPMDSRRSVSRESRGRRHGGHYSEAETDYSDYEGELDSPSHRVPDYTYPKRPEPPERRVSVASRLSDASASRQPTSSRAAAADGGWVRANRAPHPTHPPYGTQDSASRRSSAAFAGRGVGGDTAADASHRWTHRPSASERLDAATYSRSRHSSITTPAYDSAAGTRHKYASSNRSIAAPSPTPGVKPPSQQQQPSSSSSKDRPTSPGSGLVNYFSEEDLAGFSETTRRILSGGEGSDVGSVSGSGKRR
ncbi:hypothetical protein HK104_004447, partial [Borealophlyctis nickersoniae]